MMLFIVITELFSFTWSDAGIFVGGEDEIYKNVLLMYI